MKSQVINSILLTFAIGLIMNLGLSPANANQHTNPQHEQHQGHKKCQGHEGHQKSNQLRVIQST